ncbi:MAG: hypothetical protein SVR94_08285, partial [Pseudomonadota bacterium]|nr:hypothetical protein [Pseudomonadota bacterium]
HNGLTLDKPGKAVLIERFEELLATQHPYKNRKIQCRDQVQLECQALASTLLKDRGDEADGAFSVDYL